MKKAIVLSLVLAALNSAFVRAQSSPSEKEFAATLDATIVKTLERVPDVPAITVAVVKGDQAIFVKAYGVADRATGLKADNDTLFYIASSTTSYMALAAAILDREGKI